MTVHAALRAIVDNANEKSFNWAIRYAQHGLSLPESDELRVQCLYILNNITRWRGELAKTVRETLQAYTKIR
jgi:hypothetical protein